MEFCDVWVIASFVLGGCGCSVSIWNKDDYLDPTLPQWDHYVPGCNTLGEQGQPTVETKKMLI